MYESIALWHVARELGIWRIYGFGLRCDEDIIFGHGYWLEFGAGCGIGGESGNGFDVWL